MPLHVPQPRPCALWAARGHGQGLWPQVPIWIHPGVTVGLGLVPSLPEPHCPFPSSAAGGSGLGDPPQPRVPTSQVGATRSGLPQCQQLLPPLTQQLAPGNLSQKNHPRMGGLRSACQRWQAIFFLNFCCLATFLPEKDGSKGSGGHVDAHLWVSLHTRWPDGRSGAALRALATPTRL